MIEKDPAVSTSAEPPERLKVLLVEDDTFLEGIAVQVLSHDFDVKPVVNGETVLKEANAFMPDVIMLDVVLPGEKSGLDILDDLRADHAFDSAAVIMFTNLSDDENKKRALTHGADAYIVKAEFNIGNLGNFIRKYVAIRRAT
ncbi:MAG: response regulator [Patescibacteria group bacterium]|nr:response regulator [Patescibacteria group bacterium]